jgi:hypothetical protein
MKVFPDVSQPSLPHILAPCFSAPALFSPYNNLGAWRFGLVNVFPAMFFRG